MITFVITKDKYTEIFECSLTDSILSLKKQIIERFRLKSDYIDIDFKIDIPIRQIGKFNLEKGILPRTLDLYTFDRYGLDDKTVNATFYEVDDYEPIQPKKNPIRFKKDLSYLNKKDNSKNNSNESILTFNLNSNDDFPSLC